MPSIDLLIAFAIATLIFAYIPGPAILYTAAQTLARGRKGGLMAALGIHCGGYAHVLGATFGLSALFQHVPTLYTIFEEGLPAFRRAKRPAAAVADREVATPGSAH